ncbi:sensor histidine kinase [Undibacterium jejuense]|uniref:Sensor histidine kinase n=1 Tax=Undibacterium jejuense TaxID=1344949 RepID=A0A923KPL4_9BURK|nr:sensor histidine kinase [Undibacterium jejuense]
MISAKQISAAFRFPWVPDSFGHAPYFWLLSLGIFGLKYFYQAPTIFELVLSAVTLFLFLPCYFYSFWAPQRLQLLCALAIYLAGIAWAPFNFGSSTFCIFASSMIGHKLPTRTSYLCLFSLTGVTSLLSFVLHFNAAFWIPATIFSVTAGVSVIVGEKFKRTQESLLRKQEEVEHLAALAERERIARDMHDVLGHSLSVITLKAELARKLFDRDRDACKKELIDIEHAARVALSEVRTALTGYRSTGLAHELHSAQEALAAAQVIMTQEIASVALTPMTENVIALALKEATTNIIRHAHASVCHIRLTEDPEQITFSIKDDGIGRKNFSIHKQGNGLMGMSERVASLGGRLIIEAEQGMTLMLQFPNKTSAKG